MELERSVDQRQRVSLFAAAEDLLPRPALSPLYRRGLRCVPLSSHSSMEKLWHSCLRAEHHAAGLVASCGCEMCCGPQLCVPTTSPRHVKRAEAQVCWLLQYTPLLRGALRLIDLLPARGSTTSASGCIDLIRTATDCQNASQSIADSVLGRECCRKYVALIKSLRLRCLKLRPSQQLAHALRESGYLPWRQVALLHMQCSAICLCICQHRRITMAKFPHDRVPSATCLSIHAQSGWHLQHVKTLQTCMIHG